VGCSGFLASFHLDHHSSHLCLLFKQCVISSSRRHYMSDSCLDGGNAAFMAWAEQHGIQAGITLTSNSGGVGENRGCAAVHDLAAGDTVLSIPRALLIYADTIRETDLGAMLLTLPDLPGLIATDQSMVRRSVAVTFWHSRGMMEEGSLCVTYSSTRTLPARISRLLAASQLVADCQSPMNGVTLTIRPTSPTTCCCCSP
jgi:hypothetical protein